MPRGTARDTLCHPAHHPEAMATRAITPAMGRGRRQAVVLQAQLRSERVWAAAVQHGSWRAATTASREKSLASVSRSATGGALRARHCGRTACATWRGSVLYVMEPRLKQCNACGAF